MNVRPAIVCVLVLACGTAAFAQKRVELEIGARGGVPFTVSLDSRLTGAGAIYSSYAFERSKFSVGPAVTAVVVDRVAIEFGAIYKPIRFRSSFYSPFTIPISTTRVSSWEYPLIADYRFRTGPVRPYGGGGMLLGQQLSGTTESQVTDQRTGTVKTVRGSFRTFFTQLPAYVINGGLEWRTSRLAIRPEMRYTRWSLVSQSEEAVRHQNQFEYLVGISFIAFAR
jgi:hypothetical protein